MKFLYYCYGGSHSSVTAAAIHLGFLPADRVPSAEELMAVPYFDGQIKSDHGTFKFMGFDDRGNEIYVIGVEKSGCLFEKMIRGAADIFDVEEKEFKVVNSLKYVNNLMRLGGFLSRRAGMVAIGRPIVIKGTQVAYWDFVKLVDEVKAVH